MIVFQRLKKNLRSFVLKLRMCAPLSSWSSDCSTEHLGKIYDWLNEIVYKLMPEHNAVRRQINGILGLEAPPRRSDGSR